MQKLLISAVAVLTLGAPAFGQQNTITCTSQGSAAQTCPANTRDGVLLVREQSNNLCRQGTTWTYDRRGIQVSGGCSAEFAVSNRGNGGGGNNGYGNNGYNSNNGNGSGNSSGNGYNSGYNGNANGASNNYGNGQNGNGQNGNYGRNVSLPQGTQLTVRMDQTVRLTELNQGDVLPGTLTSDLTVGGQVVAPAGTAVQAKVASAQGSPLDLRLDSLNVNGQTYALQTNSVRGVRDAVSSDASNTRSGFGGVLSGLASAGQITSGTVFNFRLTATARPTGTN